MQDLRSRSLQMPKALASLLAALLFATLTSCGSIDGTAAGGSGSDERGVAVVKVEVPLRAPVWGPDEGAIFALGWDGRRLVKVDANRGGFNPDAERLQAVASAQDLDGVAGENLALEKDRVPDKIYVPVPGKDEVIVLEKDDLLEVRTFGAGESPSRVALGRDSDILFALSEDGSTVTAVDLIGAKEVVAEVRGNGGEDSLIEAGAGEGFWVTGPEAVAFYEGPSFERAASLELETVALAADADEVRAYAAEAGSGRVVAVQPGPDGGLEVVASRDVGAEARYLEHEENRLYAATDDGLIVLDGDTLDPIASVSLEPALRRKSIAEPNLSGLAVANERVYLILERKPYVLVVEKP